MRTSSDIVPSDIVTRIVNVRGLRVLTLPIKNFAREDSRRKAQAAAHVYRARSNHGGDSSE
jgi:hypothetical protein